MTTHEKLLENYEDALFALLMEQVAQEEGAALLEENERLKNDPNFEIPAETDARCRKTIKQAFAKKRRRKTFRQTYRVLQHTAVAMVAVIILFTSTYAAFPSVRVATLNFLIEKSDVAASLTFGGTGEAAPPSSTTQSNGDLLAGYAIPELPEDFVIIDEGEDSHSSWRLFSSNMASILIEVSHGSSNSIHNVDVEDAQNVEEIQTNNCDGLLIEKDNRIYIILADTEHEKFIDIICTEIDKEYAMNIANDIKFIK